MKEQDSPLSLGTDNLASLLKRYAMPSIIAMVSSSLYNMIDSIFIGHGVGPMAISGLALTMPLMNLAATFGAMVGAGSAALTSIRLGQGNKPAAVIAEYRDWQKIQSPKLRRLIQDNVFMAEPVRKWERKSHRREKYVIIALNVPERNRMKIRIFQ